MNKNISVLVVEDEAYTALFLKEALELEGYSVSGSVATGTAAVDSANSCPPDIVVMDIHLAGDLDGLATTEQIRRKNEIPVIFISGYRDSELFDRAQKFNPVAFLIKPFEIEELCEKIVLAFPSKA